MSFLLWIIVGLIAGWLANFITGSRSGCITDIIVGMLGSLLGGSIVIFLETRTLNFTTAFNNFDLTSIIVSTIGAIVLLIILRLVRGGK